MKAAKYDYTEQMIIAWPGNNDYKFALDVSSWGFLGMNDMAVSVLQKADQKFKFTDGTITGYGGDIIWEGVDSNKYLSSCAWYLFAKNGVNPMGPGLENKLETALASLFKKQ